MAVAFAQLRAPLRGGAQAGDGRGVDGMDGSLLTAQAHGLDGQARETPSEGPIEQGVERHLAALHGTFDPMPAPPQMNHVGQGGAGQAPLVMDKLAGKHGDEDNPDKVCGTGGQRTNQAVDRTRGQVYWLSGQRLECRGWFRHPPSISDLWPLWLLLW